MATDIGKSFNRTGFAALQLAWREDSDVCCQMRQFRMQLPPEVLHKLPYGILYICYQCIAARQSHDTKLYARRRNGVAVSLMTTVTASEESSIIEEHYPLCRGVAQPGSAPALGAGGRRFKSYRPDQYFQSDEVHFCLSVYSAVGNFVDGQVFRVSPSVTPTRVVSTNPAGKTKSSSIHHIVNASLAADLY